MMVHYCSSTLHPMLHPLSTHPIEQTPIVALRAHPLVDLALGKLEVIRAARPALDLPDDDGEHVLHTHGHRLFRLLTPSRRSLAHKGVVGLLVALLEVDEVLPRIHAAVGEDLRLCGQRLEHGHAADALEEAVCE